MILFKDCRAVARPHLADTGAGADRGAARAADLRGVDVLVAGNRVAAVGRDLALPRAPAGEEVRVVDASNLVMVPGLVNTHHHFVQTLTRAAPGAQDAKLFDWLVYLYGIWKGIDEEAVYWAARLAMAELALTGCSCTTDHHYLYPRGFSGDIPALQFRAAADAGLRFAPTRGSMSMSRKDGGLPPDDVVQDEDEILAGTAAAIDRFHDPAPDSMRRVAVGPCSPFTVSEALMRACAELGRAKGVRLHTHLAETADEDDFCRGMFCRRPLEVMEDCGFIGPDVWYAHGIFFDDQELGLLARTGTGIAHCPSSNMRLGSGVCRVRDFLDRGGIVGVAVDGSASNDSSDLLGELRQALLLQRVSRGPSALSAREALRMGTDYGARLLGFPEAGRIEEGALADLALFDVGTLGYAGAGADPVAALLFCGFDHRAAYVVVDGRFVVDGGRLSGVDEEDLRARADACSRRLFKKAGIEVR